MQYRGQRIVILGFARQGLALARYLAQAGAHVVVSDVQPAEKLAANIAALSDLTIEYALGGHPPDLLDGADLLCLSGGVDANSPVAQAARRRGIPLSNDSQIFLEQCSPGVTTVGITGSAGKTTTTTLVGRMLQAYCASVIRHSSPATWVGGNIGNPLLADVEKMRPGDFAVMELSSFQLEIMTRSPRVAAVLNITPNHLDRHGTMEAYIAAKHNLLRYLPPEGVAVLGWDNANSRNLNVLAGRTVFFSAEVEFPEGAFLREETLVWQWADDEYDVCRTSDIQLRGRHNVLNVLAACAIGGAALALNGLQIQAAVEAMRAGIAGFTGVEHRLEFVRERNGVMWYNDSIASAPERVIAALHSFDEPIVLLAGGRDKKLPWEDFAALAKTRVKSLVLFGEAGPLIQRAIESAQMDVEQYTLCPTLAEAVSVAASKAASGDIVLLSPGCTSFDEFKDFAERGEKYKEWVRAL
jgi:UDP-N-acetylmuramoylalanine--D-glutamate ligase